MGWFDFASIAPKAAENVLDKDNGLLTQFGGWIGNMDLTDEEVMKANATTVLNVQEFVKATLSESTARSKTRRDIANMWIKMHVGIILMGCIALPWNSVIAQAYFDLATSTVIGSVTAAITIFHFGSYGLARHNETKQNKQ